MQVVPTIGKQLVPSKRPHLLIDGVEEEESSLTKSISIAQESQSFMTENFPSNIFPSSQSLANIRFEPLPQISLTKSSVRPNLPALQKINQIKLLQKKQDRSKDRVAREANSSFLNVTISKSSESGSSED